MKISEELLWAYIDGICTVDEKQAISIQIATDEAIRLKYMELLDLNNVINNMELEEPSMAFTYNVMESIRAQEAAKPLNTHINRKIILGISWFFILSIAILLVYTLSSVNWSFLSDSAGKTQEYKIPDFFAFISKPVKEGFLFFDLVLAMFLIDNFLRGKKNRANGLKAENINQ